MDRVEPGDARPYDNRIELFSGHCDPLPGVKLTVSRLLEALSTTLSSDRVWRFEFRLVALRQEPSTPLDVAGHLNTWD